MHTALPLANSLLLIGATKADAFDLCKELLPPHHHAKVDAENHPDVHFYAPEGKAHLHPMASIQKLVREMALPPFEAPYKFFLIEEAEKMLPSSSNALLKTLEEPSGDTYFFLLTDHPGLLLPTILSRLQPRSFARKEIEPVDMSFYTALAQNRQWDALIDALPALETEDPKAVLHGLLIATKNPLLIERAERALQHNLKTQSIYLNILIRSTNNERQCSSNYS